MLIKCSSKLLLPISSMSLPLLFSVFSFLNGVGKHLAIYELVPFSPFAYHIKLIFNK